MKVYRIRNTAAQDWSNTPLGKSIASASFTASSQVPLPATCTVSDVLAALHEALNHSQVSTLFFCLEQVALPESVLHAMQALPPSRPFACLPLTPTRNAAPSVQAAQYSPYWRFVVQLSQIVWSRQSLAQWLDLCHAQQADDLLGLYAVLKVFTQGAPALSAAPVPCCLPPSLGALQGEVMHRLEKHDYAEALRTLDVIDDQLEAPNAQAALCKAHATACLNRTQEALLHVNHALTLGHNPVAEQLKGEITELQKKHPPAFAELREALGTIEGYLDPAQQEFLYNTVRSLPEDAQILEIGSYNGLSTAIMAFASAGTRRHITCVDTFFGNDGAMRRSVSFFDVWKKNLHRFNLQTYATAFPGYSSDVLQQQHNWPAFDFIFLDASHAYEHIIEDIQRTYPLLTPGGYMALHDVELGWPGPWRAWRECKHALHTHTHVGSLAAGYKNAPALTPRPLPWQSYGHDYALSLAEANPAHAPLTQLLMQSIPPQHGGTCPQWQARTQELSTLPDWVRADIQRLFCKDAHEDVVLAHWSHAFGAHAL